MDTAPLVTLAQIALGFLSVPVVSAVLAAALRYVLPSSRLATRLQRDLSIFKDLPPSPEKDVFEANINRTLGALNARLAPELKSKRAIVARRVLTVAFSVLGFLFGVLLVIYGFVQSAANGTTSLLVSVLSGAVATAAAFIASETRRRASVAASAALRASARAVAEAQAAAAAEAAK